MAIYSHTHTTAQTHTTAHTHTTTRTPPHTATAVIIQPPAMIPPRTANTVTRTHVAAHTHTVTQIPPHPAAYTTGRNHRTATYDHTQQHTYNCSHATHIQLHTGTRTHTRI